MLLLHQGDSEAIDLQVITKQLHSPAHPDEKDQEGELQGTDHVLTVKPGLNWDAKESRAHLKNRTQDYRRGSQA